MSQTFPRRDPLHDVLLMKTRSQTQELYRVPVERGGASAGAYVKPPELTLKTAPGARKVFSAANGFFGKQGPRGPALATLPVRPEPTSSGFLTCYLLNLDNLRFETPWTSEDWNDTPPGSPGGVERLPTPSEYRLVVGAPDGTAHLIERKADGSFAAAVPLELNTETEVWNALRSGLVAGSVWVEKAQAVVPIVNVASLG